jgi:hypothetical protein
LNQVDLSKAALPNQSHHLEVLRPQFLLHNVL